MFAFMSDQQKMEVCARITVSGVQVLPHSAKTILVKGIITLSDCTPLPGALCQPGLR